jgi:S-adenosylmethionine:tRNA ribosyltransferase-isomerase
MRTDDFAFDLPPGQIAQQPAEPRDASQLMVLHQGSPPGSLEHRHFRDLPSLLSSGDLLVINDTRVMAARLRGVRPDTGGAVEALLVRPAGPNRWLAMFRPGRQAVPGRRFRFESSTGPLDAAVTAHEDALVALEFDREFDPASVGTVPLPPYISAYAGDPERYQTVYGREPRSAAAPTAGLHFTPDLMARLEGSGVSFAPVTLAVGPGTFKPVTAADPRDHVLDAEHVAVPKETASAIRAAKAEGRRVIAVGTTVVRTLEHVARARSQVEPYEGWANLVILPGDEFRVIDGLITNFHLPRSTLLMLVCAFAGKERVLAAYREAVAAGYGFYSFGDAMLLLP